VLQETQDIGVNSVTTATCKETVAVVCTYIASSTLSLSQTRKFSLSRLSNRQDDRVYAAAGKAKKKVHFLNPLVKINGQYYRETLLKEELLPDMRDISEYSTLSFSRTARQLNVRRKQLIFFRLKH